MKNPNKLVSIIIIGLFFILAIFLLFLKYKKPVTILKTGVEIIAQDRILILAPHPDDEVLGCGGIIQKALALQVPVRIAL